MNESRIARIEGLTPRLANHVQIAIDRGMLEAFPASVTQIGPGQFQAMPGPRFEPQTLVMRGVLATKLNLFVEQFRLGN